jgi:co-chaperonin GroES (HSP10)
LPVLAYTPKTKELSQASDPKKALMDGVGDLSGIELFFNQILVAIYISPDKTKGGVYLPDSAVQEDIYQGKCGLVLMKGPMAFKDDAQTEFMGQDVEVGDWVAFRVGDTWQLTLNGISCRLITDRNIKMRVAKPGIIF